MTEKKCCENLCVVNQLDISLCPAGKRQLACAKFDLNNQQLLAIYNLLACITIQGEVVFMQM